MEAAEANVIVETKDRYAVIRINRPKALNALNADVLRELEQAMEALSARPEMRAVILTGQGEKAFVAGADIAAMKDMSPDQAREFAELGHAAMNAIAGSRLISVAAVNGFALGGGLELALACDLRFVAETAKLGLPEVTLGLIPGFGGTQRLPRIVGRGLALEIIASGDMFGADRALAMGLANRLYPAEELLSKTEEFVQGMIQHKSGSAQAEAKRALDAGLDLTLPEGLAREIEGFAGLFSGEDPRTGMSAFLEKRKADF